MFEQLKMLLNTNIWVFQIFVLAYPRDSKILRGPFFTDLLGPRQNRSRFLVKKDTKNQNWFLGGTTRDPRYLLDCSQEGTGLRLGAQIRATPVRPRFWGLPWHTVLPFLHPETHFPLHATTLSWSDGVYTTYSSCVAHYKKPACSAVCNPVSILVSCATHTLTNCYTVVGWLRTACGGHKPC